MLKDLWIAKVEGCLEDVAELARSISDMAPRWFLHGSTGGRSIDPEGEDDRWTLLLFGEGDFVTQNSEAKGLHITTELSEEEYEEALTAAAAQAVRLAMHPNNYRVIGELLLKRHPECRESESDSLAIVRAALAERSDMMSDEEYEEL